MAIPIILNVERVKESGESITVYDLITRQIHQRINSRSFTESVLAETIPDFHLRIRHCEFNAGHLLDRLEVFLPTVPSVRLTFVTMSHCSLAVLPAEISATPEASFWRAVRELDLSHNRLDTLPPWFASHLQALVKLRIDFNQIVKMPAFMARLQGLSQLFVFPNALPQVPFAVQKAGARATIGFLITETQSIPDPITPPLPSAAVSQTEDSGATLLSTRVQSGSSRDMSQMLTRRSSGRSKAASNSQPSLDGPFAKALRDLGLEGFSSKLAENGINSAEALTALTPVQLSQFLGMPVSLCRTLLKDQAASVAEHAKKSRCSGGSGSALLSSPARMMSLEPVRPSMPPRKKSPRPAAPQPDGQRQGLINELLQTELSYHAGLSSLLSDYEDPLKEVLSSADLALIFGGVAELREFSRETLGVISAEIEKEDPLMGTGLSTLFASSVYECSQDDPVTQLFANFIVKLVQINSRLSFLKGHAPPFTAVLDKCESVLAGTGLLGLNSLLVTPFQRICRYLLLLKDLHKLTSPDHADWEALTKLFQRLSTLVQTVNELKRHQDVLLQLDRRLTGNLDAMRESTVVLRLAEIEAPHRWIRRLERLRVGSRCIDCRQLFHWPSDENCFTCLRCQVLAHKNCTRTLAVGCQDPSLLNNTSRIFTGQSWSSFHYAPYPKSGVLTRRCLVYIFSDSLLVTAPGEGPEAQQQTELFALVRWYSFTKRKEITLARKGPGKLVITAPRDGERHAITASAKHVDELSALVQRIEVARLEWNLLRNPPLHDPPPSPAATPSLARLPSQTSSLSSPETTFSSSSSAPSPSSPVSAAQSRDVLPPVVVESCPGEILLPSTGVRFHCVQTAPVPQQGKGTVLGYIVHVIFQGKSRSVTVLPSHVLMLHRQLKQIHGESYRRLLTKSSRPPSRRKLVRSNVFRQQKNVRILTAWFNQLLALDNPTPVLQSFLNTVTHTFVSYVTEHSDDDDVDDVSTSSSTSSTTSTNGFASRSRLPSKLDKAANEANMVLNLPMFLSDLDPAELPTLGTLGTIIFPFEALSEDELAAAEGERLHILVHEGEWMKALNSSGVIGWIPTNHVVLDEIENPTLNQ